MQKKTWKIIVRHLVLALLAIIWLIPIVWLDTGKLSSTVLQDRYSSELSGMV